MTPKKSRKNWTYIWGVAEKYCGVGSHSGGVENCGGVDPRMKLCYFEGISVAACQEIWRQLLIIFFILGRRPTYEKFAQLPKICINIIGRWPIFESPLAHNRSGAKGVPHCAPFYFHHSLLRNLVPIADKFYYPVSQHSRLSTNISVATCP